MEWDMLKHRENVKNRNLNILKLNYRIRLLLWKGMKIYGQLKNKKAHNKVNGEIVKFTDFKKEPHSFGLSLVKAA